MRIIVYSWSVPPQDLGRPCQGPGRSKANEGRSRFSPSPLALGSLSRREPEPQPHNRSTRLGVQARPIGRAIAPHTILDFATSQRRRIALALCPSTRAASAIRGVGHHVRQPACSRLVLLLHAHLWRGPHAPRLARVEARTLRAAWQTPPSASPRAAERARGPGSRTCSRARRRACVRGRSDSSSGTLSRRGP